MKKLLIWDGDNSLWDGVLVEGSVPQLPDGRYELCEELSRRGVIQSLASYNLQKDVELALHLLNLDRFFLVPKASFGSHKSNMIQSIMGELNIAKPEDVVFVDDEPFNLAEVKEAIPGIRCMLPKDFYLEADGLFSKESYTDEDTKRVAMYRSELVRKEAGKAFGGDHIAFLRNCDMHMAVFEPSPADMDRIRDLVGRAHKLSAVMFKSPESGLELLQNGLSLVAIRAWDKFGAYGLSGVLGFQGNIIKLLVISCRLQGKGYGSTLLGWWINRMGQDVGAEWIETEYNSGIRALYEWYKFSIINSGNSIKANRKFAEAVELPDWIEVIDETASRGNTLL